MVQMPVFKPLLQQIQTIFVNKMLFIKFCSVLLLSLYWCMFQPCAYAQKVKPALIFSHLAGDYYVYTTHKLYDGAPYPANSMYVVTQAGIVLFDTPWDTTQFQPLLDSLLARHKMKVVLCIATHFHADRTAGLTYYNSVGIPTYTSLQTYDSCKSRGEKQAAHYFVNDTVFTVGDHSFETYYAGAGHTADNIIIWSPDAKIIYGGCLVKSTATNDLGNIADTNLKEWPQTMKRIITKYPSPAFVIPGHLGWKKNTALQHTLKLLRKHGN